MINVKNPPALSLGENRIYFGLWSIMKAPLLLSSDLPTLTPAVIAIVNNTEVIAMNQDELGVQARKLVVDGAPLPWLVGLADCAAAPKVFRNRNDGFDDTGVDDNRQWSVLPTGVDANSKVQQYAVKSLSTGRCLSAYGSSAPTPTPGPAGVAAVVAPCDAADPDQQWMYSVGSAGGEVKSKKDGLCLQQQNDGVALGACAATADNLWTFGGDDGKRFFADVAKASCVQVFNYSGPVEIRKPPQPRICAMTLVESIRELSGAVACCPPPSADMRSADDVTAFEGQVLGWARASLFAKTMPREGRRTKSGLLTPAPD